MERLKEELKEKNAQLEKVSLEKERYEKSYIELKNQIIILKHEHAMSQEPEPVDMSPEEIEEFKMIKAKDSEEPKKKLNLAGKIGKARKKKKDKKLKPPSNKKQKTEFDPNMRTGQPGFLEKVREFKDDGEPPELLHFENGHELAAAVRTPYFESIMLINRPEGLGMSNRITAGMTLNDVLTFTENALDSKYPWLIIDSLDQQPAGTMAFGEFAERLRTDDGRRERIPNSLSNNLGENSKCRKLLVQLELVRCVSLADRLGEKPDVEHYLLISERNAYTDWHLDFGGSKVSLNECKLKLRTR